MDAQFVLQAIEAFAIKFPLEITSADGPLTDIVGVKSDSFLLKNNIAAILKPTLALNR